MNLTDLVYEGVRNSLEAGASRVFVNWRVEKERIYVEVADDGRGDFPPDCFQKGVSDKGEKRGRGLYLIKSADPNARLERKGGVTLLTFSAGKSLEGDLASYLPYLFSLGLTEFNFLEDGKVTRIERKQLLGLYKNLESVKALSGMKKLFGMFDIGKKESIYG